MHCSHILYSLVRYVAFFLLFLCLPASVLAGQCAEEEATAVSIQGVVETRSRSSTQWKKVSAEDTFCVGDRVRTLANSRAALQLNNNSILRLNEHSTITFSGLSPQGSSRLDLKTGMVHFINRLKQRFEVITPYVNAGTDGTEFVVAVDTDAEQTNVTVFEGRVRASNDQGEISLNSGETVLAKAGEAPLLQTRVQPWNAVSWALYYPAVSDFTNLTDARLTPSLQHYRQGQFSAALTALNSLPNELANSNSYVYRAALYLVAGQATHADTDLEQALKQDDKNGDALALKAIIAVVQNRPEQALERASQAVEASSDTIAPWLAQSYAQQAVFDLKQAKLSVEQAVKLAPESALSWARLAELHLMFGELDQALQAAQRATDFAPELARTQSVLGFAYLTRIKTKEAKRAFEKAISLDQADPQPRLGLGLALIRRGELALGRQQIEIAASLAPTNPLIRSYLGKAYYEEKRSPLDATQFALAKELDPNDPTPWFYDAIRKQTENRPVEALQDLEKSVELNGNRAVYRSRLLLDGDQAARSVSQARIYRDLGFEQLARQESARSLSLDPANHAAHRLLADTYVGLPRHEIARVSEALQAQLLAPISMKPTAPTLLETNLGTLSNAGPSQSGINEYNSLFSRNNDRFDFSLIGGNNGTIGDEAVYTILYDDIVVSLGQYHYRTDGFRPNNDLKQDIVNFFIQSDFSPKHSIQFEFKNKQQENGDLALRFDPNNFSTAKREEEKINTYRIGYLYKITAKSKLLASVIYQDQKFDTKEDVEVSPIGPFGPIIVEDDIDQDTNDYNTEIQYLYSGDVSSLIFGASDTVQNGNKTSILQFTSGGVVLSGEPSTNIKVNENSTNIYLYNYIDIFDAVNITLGLSNDDYNSDIGIYANQVNSKFGLIWDITPNITARAAAFRTLKRNLTSNQSLEPTQIAGFNQFFDDPLATDAKRYAIGLDYVSRNKIFYGLELSKRELDFPVLDNNSVLIKEIDENLSRAYFNWLMSKNIAVSVAYEYEDFEKTVAPQILLNKPKKLNTRKIPISFSYHGASGIFSKLISTYYNQSIIQPTASGDILDSDQFWLVNLTIGYKLPKKYGLIAVTANNLFDEEFKYYDSEFFSGIARNPELQHDRALLLQFTLNYL